MDNMLIDFLRGATMMAEIGIATFFWKYYRETEDRLFVFFAFAFAILAISQVIVFQFGNTAEFAPYGYLVRLLAFVLIIVAIADKNRPKTEPKDTKSE